MNVQTLRKAVASVSALTIMLSTFIVPGMGVNVANAAWFDAYVNVANDLNMSVSDVAGNPGANMDRCKLAELYVEAQDSAVGITESEVVDAMADVQFTDTNGNCQVAAELMLDWGLMYGQGGSDAAPSTSFGAYDVLNKNDQAVVAFRYDTVVLGNAVMGNASTHRFSDVDYTQYYGPAILHLTENGYILGEGGTVASLGNNLAALGTRFGNAGLVNLATGLTIVIRITRLGNSDGTSTGNGFATVGIDAIAAMGGVTNVNVNMSAGLASSTPASGTVLAGQATADLAHFVFNGTGTVTSMTLRRLGFSNGSTLTNVYVFDGNVRDSDGNSFNNNGDMTINGLDLAVVGSKTVSIRADIAAAAVAGSIGVELVSFTVDGTVVPVMGALGNIMSLVAGAGLLATAVVGANTVAAAAINPGTNGIPIWSAPVAITTNTVRLMSANFRAIGSAEAGSLGNLRLFKNGVDLGVLGVETVINGSTYFSFDFGTLTVLLTTGSTTLELRADIIKGSARTIQINLQLAADLILYDTQVGVNIAATGLPNTAGIITINAGTLVISLDTTFQQKTKVTGGTTNAVIGKFKFRAYGEDIKKNTFTFLPILGVMTPAANGLQNVTVYLNGQQVGTQTANWAGGNITITPGSQMILIAGEDMYVEIRADVRTVTGGNYSAGTVSVNLIAAAASGEGMRSHNSIGEPAATGNILSVQVGTVALSKSSTYADSQLLIPNKQGQMVASFNLQNTTSEGARVTQIVVGNTFGGGAVATDFSTEYLMDGSGVALSPVKVAALGGNASTPVQMAAAITFTTDFVLGDDSTTTNTRRVDVYVDANSVPAAGTLLVTLTATFIGMSSNVAGTVGPIGGQTGIVFNTATVTNPFALVTDTGSTTAAQFIPGNTTDGSKFTINFTSAGGAAVISKVGFVVTGLGTVSGMKVGTGTLTSIQTVGGLETASVNGLSISVPVSGSGVNTSFFVSYPAVGVNGIASTSTSSVAVAFIEYQSGSITKTLCTAAWAVAFGIAPCTAVLGAGVSGNTMTLVGSVPVFTVQSSSEVLSNSLVKIIEVTVAANAKGDIKLGRLPITVSSSGVASVVAAANNIVVKDINGTTIPTTNPGLAVGAGATGTDIITFGSIAAPGDSDVTAYLIPAGTSVKFKIYTTPATVSGAVNTTSLATTLNQVGGRWYDIAGNNLVALLFSAIFNFPTNPSIIYN